MTWLIVTLAIAGVILRPGRLPEALWAVTGAVLLVALGLLPPARAALAVGKGLDVYLFLTGMMLLSELGRLHGVFDWIAGIALKRADGSGPRLFLDLYVLGVIVTVFLSNDATAVVLTPAVLAVTRSAGVNPLPYLFSCALVANAASFVLPISNPANIVLYGGHTPALIPWLRSFLLPAVLAIVATGGMLYLTQRQSLTPPQKGEAARLTRGGKVTVLALLLTAFALVTVSALDDPLGLPTFLCGVGALVLVGGPFAQAIRGVSWSALALVAGLFVLVEAIDPLPLAHFLQSLAPQAAGAGLAVTCNLMNNLPAGLLTSEALALGHPSQRLVDCLLVGVDLGPNLAVTGSLATVLWLQALRREGLDVNFWQFLRVGALVMPPALLLALAVM